MPWPPALPYSAPRSASRNLCKGVRLVWGGLGSHFPFPPPTCPPTARSPGHAGGAGSTAPGNGARRPPQMQGPLSAPSAQARPSAQSTSCSAETVPGRGQTHVSDSRRRATHCMSLKPQCVLSRFSRVRLCATLCTVAHQAPLSTGFSRQGFWSGLPCPPPGDLSQSRDGTQVSLVSCIDRWVLYH